MRECAAANQERFNPPEFSDPEFWSWATRIALRFRNLPPGSSDAAMHHAIVMDGTPSPAYAHALAFMMTLAVLGAAGLQLSVTRQHQAA